MSISLFSTLIFFNKYGINIACLVGIIFNIVLDLNEIICKEISNTKVNIIENIVDIITSEHNIAMQLNKEEYATIIIIISIIMKNSEDADSCIF